MDTLYLIFYLIAAACFAFVAVGKPTDRVNFLALGLLAWVLVPLVQTARGQ